MKNKNEPYDVDNLVHSINVQFCPSKIKIFSFRIQQLVTIMYTSECTGRFVVI